MIRVLDLRGRPLNSRDLRDVVPRAAIDVEQALEAVRPICTEVRERGLERVTVERDAYALVVG